MIEVTGNQIMAHMIGDYVIQSDWMANNKARKCIPAILHAISYSIPFLFLTDCSVLAFAGICISHFVIDHWRLARYVVFAKNFFSPKSEWPKWENCCNTGYPDDRPAWLAVWLMIIADNVMHVILNAVFLAST